MKFLCIGAGAIGTYIGGSLALAGHPVVFLEHPSVVDRLRTQGLTLQMGGERHRVESPAVSPSIQEALALGPFEVGIFALKSFDTASALESLKPCAAELPPILCLSNGVENESILAQHLGKDKVIAGTVTSSVGRLGAGHIILERLRGVGCDSSHPLSAQITTERPS